MFDHEYFKQEHTKTAIARRIDSTKKRRAAEKSAALSFIFYGGMKK